MASNEAQWRLRIALENCGAAARRYREETEANYRETWLNLTDAGASCRADKDRYGAKVIAVDVLLKAIETAMRSL
jgi:hypothetical protein